MMNSTHMEAISMASAYAKLIQISAMIFCGISAAQAQPLSPTPALPELSLEYKSARHEWREALVRDGYYNPLMPKPYRLAIPLIDGQNGKPKLMLGFAPRLRSVDGKNVVLIFTAIPLD